MLQLYPEDSKLTYFTLTKKDKKKKRKKKDLLQVNESNGLCYWDLILASSMVSRK